MGDVEIEPSVQMRLYTLNKRHFALVFFTFITCFSITIIVGLSGPPVMQLTEQNATSLIHAPTDLATGPFNLKSPPLSTFCQQLWLTMTATLHAGTVKSGKLEVPFSLTVMVHGLVEDDSGISESVLSDQLENHSRLLRCKGQECEDIIVLHLAYLAYPHYVITVRLYGLEPGSFDNVTFKFTHYNASFTQLEIWFRFAFLLLSFIFTCWFAHSLRKFAIHDWSIEQKWMTLLLPLLLLYDNPIFPLTFLINSWVPGILDTVFQATFLASLLLYWLCIYHGVRQNKRRMVSFYLPKLLLVGFLWLLVVVLSCWQEFKQLRDPTFDYQLDTGYATAVRVVFAAAAGFYVLYLLYLLVRAYAELRAMPYFDLRLKFMTVLMLIVLGVSITIAVLRFGVQPIMADHFIPELSTHYQNSAMFAAFYGLLNFYMFTMAFVYSPSKNAIYESNFKDNPALSMLNDSEDEVVYGEETSLKHKMTTNRYDSDEEAFN